MPELPEVETMCRAIAPIVGGRIVDVRRPRSRLESILIEPRLPSLRRRIVGGRVMRVDRLGKLVVAHLDTSDRLVIEPRMTGLVLLRNPPDSLHVRLEFVLEGSRAEQFLFWDQRGLGVVRLLGPAQFDRIYGPDAIGPDALAIDLATLRARLGRSRRPIKVALMDQQALAGIGNLYASEILFRAGVNPVQHCTAITAGEWERIHARMRDVLLTAIRCEGSTLRDGTYRVSRETVGGYQLHHGVYQRHGEKCLACGRAEIVRIVQAQRSTFFCPVCQAKRRSRK